MSYFQSYMWNYRFSQLKGSSDDGRTRLKLNFLSDQTQQIEIRVSLLYPRFNEVDRGVYWYHLVRLSVRPSVDRIVSALYLQQYSSDPFHICTSYQATSEGVWRVMPVSKFKNLKFLRIFKICNFDFVIFWLGIQYDSMVWVIMRRRGVSSERRCSSCSSLFCLLTFIPAWRSNYIHYKVWNEITYPSSNHDQSSN